MSSAVTVTIIRTAVTRSGSRSNCRMSDDRNRTSDICHPSSDICHQKGK
jgi:hypothetical protein